MGHGHGHGGHGHGGHGHGGRPTPERALWVAIALNASFLFLEAGVGLWSGSLALLSDAGHMISDVGSLLVAVLALRLRRRRPDARYTFGLRRAPVLGALINGVALVVIVVLIAREAVERFAEPPSLPGWPVLITGLAGLFVNLISAWYLARSADKSVNVRGAMLHLLADALGSVAAIVSAVLLLFFGFRLADPIASLVIALLILYSSIPLLRETVAILLQRAPAGVEIEEVEALFKGREEVVSLVDLHLWELDSGAPVLSALLLTRLATLDEADALTDALREELKERFSIAHATIECRKAKAADCALEH